MRDWWGNGWADDKIRRHWWGDGWADIERLLLCWPGDLTERIGNWVDLSSMSAPCKMHWGGGVQDLKRREQRRE